MVYKIFFKIFNIFGWFEKKQTKIKHDEAYFRFNDSESLEEIIKNYDCYKGIPFITNYETKNKYYYITNFDSYDLKKYKVTKFKKKIMLEYVDKEDIIEINQDNNDEICCSICYEEIKKTQNIVKMDVCNHQYHDNCALKTLNYKEECPVCRKNINDDIKFIQNEKECLDNSSIESEESYDYDYEY